MNRSWSSLRSTVSRFRACWRPLARCDIAGKTAAFVLMTPLVAALFRLLLAWSGREVLAGQDILIFLLRPAGLVSAVVLGGMLLAIVALEQAALMAVLYAHEGGRRPDVVAALRFALAHAAPGTLSQAKMAAMQQFERTYLINLLTVHHGNITHAAKAAGKERRTFQRLLNKHQLHRSHFA